MTSEVNSIDLRQDSRALAESEVERLSGALADSELDAASGGTMVETMATLALFIQGAIFG